LPDEFGIGIALKMLWGKDDAAGDAVWWTMLFGIVS